MKYRERKKLTGYERVMKRTKIPTDQDKCWLWCGPVNNAGYGMIRGNDGIPRMATVHRVVGVHLGMNPRKEIQHTCLTKHCVNPKHLVEGNPKTRHDRIVKKYGKNYKAPKNPYHTCEHCGTSTYVTHFSRKHKHCYPGMRNDLSKLLKRKV